ncbi:MAG: hypothetical protein MJ203_04810 [archaeon]|nr:hypothetical protein [archaeon]
MVESGDSSGSGSGVVQSGGYKLNSFMKNLYVSMDFIKCIVDLGDYSQVAKGATDTPLPGEERTISMDEMNRAKKYLYNKDYDSAYKCIGNAKKDSQFIEGCGFSSTITTAWG